MALDVYKDWLGIPEGPRPPDHFSLLRLVQFEDDADKIRANYRKLNAHVRKYASGQYSAQSQELLNELARAMLCLTDPQRKREYDESLGREFDESTALHSRSMGDWLSDEGHCTRDQLREAESFADARGLSLRDAVVQMKLVDVETATRAFAEELGRPFVELNDMIPDDSVLDRIPRNFVKRHQILPLFVDDDMLLLACVHEPTPELEEEMRLRFEMPMRAVMATPLAVNQAIAKYFAPGMRDEAVAQQATAKAPNKKKAKQAAPKQKKLASQMSDDEKHQKKMIGRIVLCWSVIGLAGLNHFVIKPLLGNPGFWLFDFPFLLVALSAGGFIWVKYLSE